MKHNKIIISILTIFIILLSVGCSNKQENIPDSNENVNADYDSLFQELEEKYDATLGIYALDTETNKEISYNADERFAYCSTYKALAAGAILEKYSIEELDNVIYFEEEDVLSYSLISDKPIIGSGRASISAFASIMVNATSCWAYCSLYASFSASSLVLFISSSL